MGIHLIEQAPGVSDIDKLTIQPPAEVKKTSFADRLYRHKRAFYAGMAILWLYNGVTASNNNAKIV